MQQQTTINKIFKQKKTELANQQQNRKVKIKIDTTIPSKLLANESEDEGKSSNPSKTSIAAHPRQKQYQIDRPAPFKKGKLNQDNKNTTLTSPRQRPRTASPHQRENKMIIPPGTSINRVAKTQKDFMPTTSTNKRIRVASGLDTTQTNMTPHQNTSRLSWPVHKRYTHTQQTQRSHTIKSSHSQKNLHRRFTRFLQSS